MRILGNRRPLASVRELMADVRPSGFRPWNIRLCFDFDFLILIFLDPSISFKEPSGLDHKYEDHLEAAWSLWRLLVLFSLGK